MGGEALGVDGGIEQKEKGPMDYSMVTAGGSGVKEDSMVKKKKNQTLSSLSSLNKIYTPTHTHSLYWTSVVVGCQHPVSLLEQHSSFVLENDRASAAESWLDFQSQCPLLPWPKTNEVLS